MLMPDAIRADIFFTRSGFAGLRRLADQFTATAARVVEWTD